MDLFLKIVQMVLPVIVLILLGYVCNKRKIIDISGLRGIKNIIGSIMLPVVLFNAFYTAEYNSTVLITFILIFISCGIALFLAFLTRKFVKPYGKFYPFLMTSFECGMLGYALYGLLIPNASGTFAIIDIGQTIFAYTVYLAALKITDGERATPKAIVINMLKNPPCVGMMLGILFGLIGVNDMIGERSFGLILNDVIVALTAPTVALILIVVGYELSFSRKLIKPVLTTVGIRLLVMTALCAVVSLVLFAIIPFDKSLFVALMLMFSLPAPFIVPLFADVSGHGEYISTTLSISTLATIVVFTGISVYVMA